MSQPTHACPPAAVPAGQLLPPDERQVAAHLLLTAGNRLSPEESALCDAATRPGSAPLGWRARLRLSVLAGRLLGSAAP
jgi:hypothetical protein